MRVISGQWRGRRLKAPTWTGLRPTSDRLRETLFNVLGPTIREARVLDGYAGTGAIGIEALSRGAAHVTFVERDPRATRLITENLRALGADRDGRYAIIRAGFSDEIAKLSATPFDVMVLDPPYAEGAAAEALGAASRLAGPGTLVVLEHARRHEAPDRVADLVRQRTLPSGDSALSFYRAAQRGP